MKPLLVIALLAAVLAGCSSVRVTTDHAEGTDFSAFRTFQYQDSADSLAASSPLAHTRIVNAIRGAMVASGLAEVTEDPDLRVTYYGSIDHETHFQTTYSGPPHRSGSPWHNSGTGVGTVTSTTRAMTVKRGTLVIDVWDASTNTLVWRSVATSALDSDPRSSARTIKEAVERAFRQFPPQ